MADINLLEQESSVNRIKAQGKQWLSRLASLVLVLSLLTYGYLFYSGYSLENKIAESQRKISDYQSELQDNEKRDELIARQGQLKSVNQLIEKHMYWSVLLPELARVTLNSAQYTNIETDVEGEIDLTVIVPSYADAEKYLQVFDLPEYNDNFSNVKVVSLTKTEQDNLLQTTMRLNLILDPDFLKNRP